MQERARQATRRYLENVKGYEFMEHAEGFTIAKDERGAIHFVRVVVTLGDFEPIEENRAELENMAFDYIKRHFDELEECKLVFDEAAYRMVCGDKAMLRYAEDILRVA